MTDIAPPLGTASAPDAGPAGPMLSVIIVNYATADLLEQCLASIDAELARLDAPDCEVLVIDNASPDDSAARLLRFPFARLVANPVNVGFSRGVNQGLALTSGRYRLILNADIIVEPGAFRALVEVLEANGQVGVAAPRLINPDRSLQRSIRRFYTLTTILLRRTPLGRLMPDSRALREHLYLDHDPQRPLEVDWALGAALCVRERALKAVGGFDERYFLYLEDVDFCRRMQRAGWTVRYSPEAQLVHYHAQASRQGWFNRDVAVHLASSVRYLGKWTALSARWRAPLLAFFGIVLLAADAVLGASALAFALALRARTAYLEARPVAPYEELLRPAAAFFVVFALMLARQGLYRLERDRDTARVVASTLRSSLIALVAMMGFLLLSPQYREGFGVSRFVLAVFVLSTTALAALSRIALTNVVRWAGRKRFLMKRALIVGWDRSAQALGRELSRFPGIGYDLVGFVTPEATAAPAGLVAVWEPIEGLEPLVERERIQEVFFTGLARHPSLMFPALLRLRERAVDVKVVLDDAAEFTAGRADDFFGFPVARFDRLATRSLEALAKRGIDLVVAAFGLAALAPLCLPLLLALRWGRGRAIHRTRVFRGRGGGRITLPWFLPRESGARASLCERLALRFAVGHWPLLWSVLRGDLSLVGPKPLTDEEARRLEPWQLVRELIRPGLTGWWQVQRERHAHWPDMIRLDLAYLHHRGLAFDARILLTSLTILLRGRAIHRREDY